LHIWRHVTFTLKGVPPSGNEFCILRGLDQQSHLYGLCFVHYQLRPSVISHYDMKLCDLLMHLS